MPLPKEPIKLELWRERQRIAQTGRKQPESQIQKRRETRLKNHPIILTSCANCGKEKYHIPSRRKEHNFCSTHCFMEYRYSHNLIDIDAQTAKAHEATRRLCEAGTHPFCQQETHIKAQRTLGSRNYGRTWIEEKMGWALTQLGIRFEGQYPVQYGTDILGRIRHYFPDFALPRERILIECDGKHWHRNKAKDNLRQSRLTELGWRVLRFPEQEIRQDVMSCARQVQSWLPVV